MITDLKATLLNSSTAYMTWTFEQSDFQLLNGRFRTFAVTIYENFSKHWVKNMLENGALPLDMSTLRTIETVKTNIILYNLQSSSEYYISVSICNFYECGSSSLAIDIKTPLSSMLPVYFVKTDL